MQENPVNPVEDLVLLPAAAKFLNMCERNAGQKARDGIIPSVKIGGSRRYSLRKLAEWTDREMDNGKRSE